jgi:hypothetical protein
MPGGSGMFQPLGDTAKAAMLIACLAFRQDRSMRGGNGAGGGN